MNLPEKFKEYIWLVNTISRHPEGMTLEEINREWVMTGMSGGQIRMPLRRCSASLLSATPTGSTATT